MAVRTCGRAPLPLGSLPDRAARQGREERDGCGGHRGAVVGVDRQPAAVDIRFGDGVDEEPFGELLRLGGDDQPAEDAAGVDVDDRAQANVADAGGMDAEAASLADLPGSGRQPIHRRYRAQVGAVVQENAVNLGRAMSTDRSECSTSSTARSSVADSARGCRAGSGPAVEPRRGLPVVSVARRPGRPTAWSYSAEELIHAPRRSVGTVGSTGEDRGLVWPAQVERRLSVS